MSKANGAESAFGKVLTYILVVLLVLGIAGMVAYFALRAQGVTYYVEYGGERYVANGDGGSIGFLSGETYDFTVKSLTGGNVDFDVKITSNSDNNIRFSYRDEYHFSFTGNAETDDYSDVFGLQAKTGGFTVTIPQDMTVETAVETKLGGDITLIDGLSDSMAYFVITVTVGESSVRFPFMLGTKDSGIMLDPSQIVF